MTPRPTLSHRLATAVAVAGAGALVLAGCSTDTTEEPAGTGTAQESDDTSHTDDSSDTTDASDSSDGAFPVTVDAENGEVTIEDRPERIVSLSPSATEILFAIGAGDQVVAADAYSTYPAEAPATDLSGYDPNVEAIVGYEPDLVIAAMDANELVSSLEALGVPVLINGAPADIERGYDIAAGIGLATGHVDETAEVIATMRAELEEAFAEAPQGQDLRIYHELDGSFYSASSNSFIGSVYAQMGTTNIADEADTEGTGYPQLTEEAIIAADPEVIIIPDGTSYTAEDVAARPGWAEVSAVKNGHIVVVDGDIASRWGTRLPQLVQVLAEALSAAAVPAGR